MNPRSKRWKRVSMNKDICRKAWLLLLLPLFFLLTVGAKADGTWYTLQGDPPDGLGYLVCEYSGDITITFLGDCTLGGEEKSERSALGFVRRIRDNGTGFPLRYLSRLTLTDDLSVANLEGVLTDRDLQKVPKEYNFRGPAFYTEILTKAGVECVTLANNHSHDYGDSGYADTKAALGDAGVCWFGTDAPAVWRNEDGLMIGFAGISYSLSGNRYKAFQQQVETLRQLGCSAVVAVMHTGTEYEYTPDTRQKDTAKRAISCGADLVIGHHPHVVQGYDIVDGVPVVYSLGNCSFGGTTHAKDSDALAVQAVLSFSDSELRNITLRFYPISITSDERYNNYSPSFLTGKDAERVLKKMRDSTGRDPGSFDEETGAVVSVPVTRGN